MMLFPPAMPLTFHVTLVLLVLVTVAVNCCLWEIRTVADAGEIFTEMGGGGAGFVMVTTALPTAAGTALLVACTVTVAGDGTTAGAVYRPLIESIKPTELFPPIAPFTSQMTDGSLLPVTAAANCFCVLI